MKLNLPQKKIGTNGTKLVVAGFELVGLATYLCLIWR